MILCAAAPAVASAATDQYPDLKTLPPRDLRFDSVDVTGSDSGATGVHTVLRFSNTVWNAGPGRLVLRGALDPTTKRGPAFQRVYDTAGNFTELATGGTMYYHPSHNHYHFEDWGAFQLWTGANYDAWASGSSTAPSDVTGSKTTSCVLDEEFIGQVMGASWPGVFGFSGCNPNTSGDLMEGLSVGWGDTYDWWRADQWVDLGPGGHLADGDYVLRSVVDPTNKIFESPGRADQSKEGVQDNSAITRFTIKNGQLVDSSPPTGTVTIADAQASVDSSRVTLKSLGRDDVSGVDRYRVSNNGTTWSPDYTYDGVDSTPSSISWDLADSRYGGNSSLGTKTVYVQFHDTSGKWGPTQTDTIQLVAPPPMSAYAQAVTGDGPASFWRLGETSGTAAIDEQSNNPGVYVNAPTLGAPSLVGSDSANKAVTFDGSTDYMKANSSASLSFGTTFSVEAWIKPTSLPAAGQFASVVTKAESYSLQFNGPRLEFTVMQGGVRKRAQAAAGAIVAGQAYHVVGTYDGATQRLYVNGAQVVATPLTGAAGTNNNGLFVGSWDGSQEFFNGTIDDVAAYAKTLTAAQVKNHYDTGNGAPTAQPPAAPSNLAGSAFSDTRVDLTWADNSSDESSFTLQRSTDAAFTSPVTINVANDKTAYSDTGLTASTQYWYRIRSRNPVGTSAWSNTVSVTTRQTPPTTAPAAPSGTTAIAVTNSRIDVTWADNSTNEDSFVVERSTDSAFTAPQATTLPAGTTSWSDTGLAASTPYWYRVKAVNSIGSSGYSQAATATTKAAPAGYAASVAADGPVSYWRLGEATGTAATDQRAANPGTYLGGPALGAGSLLATDTANKAVGFDGSNDAVSVADSNSLDLTTGITLEAWIKPNLLPAAGQFASVMTKAEAYSIQFNGPRLEFTVIQNGVRKRLQAAAGAIATGQTYHVVGTYDGATQRLYINGSEVKNAALAGAATVTPTALYIGSWDGGTEFFNGVIDDVAVYNQALSAARVGSHYTAGNGAVTPTAPAAPSGLVAGAVSDTRIDLSWADNSSNESNFVVERSTDSAFSAPQATTLPANTTSWSDTGRPANTSYWYRVKAVNGTGPSGYSNTATATTKAAPSSYAAAVTADGPVSYWRLGEATGTAAADQRSSNPGTYSGSPGLGAGSLLASDPVDKSVSLDGSNDYVGVADSNSLDLTTGITLEAWIKPNLLPAAGQFRSVATKAESYSIQFNGPQLEFTVIQNGVRKRLQAAAGAIATGQTYHVVGTYDGTTQRLYINGAQVASAALTGAATVTPSTFDIGSWDGGSEFFSGVIDDVAVYNKALSAATVSSHYSAGSTAPAATPTTVAAAAPASTAPTGTATPAARIALVAGATAPAARHHVKATRHHKAKRAHHKAKKHKHARRARARRR